MCLTTIQSHLSNFSHIVFPPYSVLQSADQGQNLELDTLISGVDPKEPLHVPLLERWASNMDKTSAAFSLYAFLIFPEAENIAYCVVAGGKNGVEPLWLEMRKVYPLSESKSRGNSCSQRPIKGTAGADDRLLSS